MVNLQTNRIMADAVELLQCFSPLHELPTTGDLLTYCASYQRLASHARVPVCAVLAYNWASIRLSRFTRLDMRFDFHKTLHCVNETPHITLLEKASVYGALSEQLILVARVHEGAEAASLAAQYAQAASCQELWRYTQVLHATALALNGEFITSERTMDDIASRCECASQVRIPKAAQTSVMAAVPSYDNRNWPYQLVGILNGSRRSIPELLAARSARSYAAPGCGTVGGVGGQIASMRIPAEDERGIEPLTQALNAYVECVIDLVSGDFTTVREICETWRHRLGFEGLPYLFRILLTACECLALIQSGYPAKVLTLLQTQKSPPDHVVCFELLRANAYIQLDNPQKAIDATGECITMEGTHSLASYASMLLRRAVAFEMLGQHDCADSCYSRASHLAGQTGGIVPPLGLPMGIVAQLFERMSSNEPDFARRIWNLRQMHSRQFNAEFVAGDCGELTRRELLLAEQLATGKVFRDIAAEQFVSINTLKSQARSLYRKLGCSSREEAVEILRHAGFFV
jgi:DNA-binding CsgD family transcriptional regulator